MQDAFVIEISLDRRFATAYNAVLQLTTIVLYASGYRASVKGHHYTTISALPDILGPDAQELADYFNNCRAKRHNIDYDRTHAVTKLEVEELLREACLFRSMVKEWLETSHPDLLADVNT